MPIYSYRHPRTGEIFEDFRLMRDADTFVAPDGETCERVVNFESFRPINKTLEFWERFPNDVKRSRPKFVRDKAGRRLKYDPTRHF